MTMLHRCLRDEEMDNRQPAEKTHPLDGHTKVVLCIEKHCIKYNYNFHFYSPMLNKTISPIIYFLDIFEE